MPSNIKRQRKSFNKDNKKSTTQITFLCYFRVVKHEKICYNNHMESEKDISLPPLHAIIRDKTAFLHCRELPNDYKLSQNKKTIIIFPGGACTDSKSANGMCKIVEGMLGPYARLCNIICFYFPELNPDMTLAEKRLTAQNTADHFFEQYFIPLITKKDEQTGNLSRISPNLAAGNTSRVMFFTHCYGSYILESLEDNITKTMPELNYKEMEIANITKQILAVNNNNISEFMGIKDKLLTYLNRITKKDPRQLGRTYPEGSCQRFIQKEQLTDDEILLTPFTKSCWSLVVNQLTHEKDEHNGGYWSQNKTAIGLLEEKIVSALLQESLLSKTPLQSIPKRLQEAQSHGILQLDPGTYQDMVTYGQEFADDYQSYRKENHYPPSNTTEIPPFTKGGRE